MSSPAAPSLYDVIVVGAGPGGATCAWKAAEAGLSVLLLERAAELPRYKPCGGGIPSSLSRHVPGIAEGLDEFSDLSVTHLRHSWKGKDTLLAPMTTDSGEPATVWMVMRSKFDGWLVARAQEHGATLRTGVKVASVETDADGVTVRSADGEEWRARHVVGADGAKGVVGPKVGLRLGKRWGIAREAEIPFGGVLSVEGEQASATQHSTLNTAPLWHPALEPGAAYLDYGSVPDGYAWIFPKRGFLSVGAGLLLPSEPKDEERREVGHVLRAAIDTMLGSVGLSFPEGADAPRIWGHPIPYWTGMEPLATADGRALLVGDAAGVVQPLFGEGIQYAVRSGAIAAGCLAAGAVPSYTDRIRAEFADEFDAARRIGRVFYKAPYLSYRLGVKNPAGTRLVGRLMAGEASLAALEQRIYDRLKNPLRRK